MDRCEFRRWPEVKKKDKPYLRLHQEESIEDRRPNAFQSSDEVAECLKCFTEATGWGIRSSLNKRRFFEQFEVANQVGYRDEKHASHDNQAASRWELLPISPLDGELEVLGTQITSAVGEQQAQGLLQSIERLVERLERAEAAVREQQAVLATDVSISRKSDAATDMADRLESILASCCRSIGGISAAIYLLDDGTSELKMRASYNLPLERLMAPARQLRGSLADLEAMLGNAVLIEDTASSPSWPTPEAFPSAVVVPIGTASMPHGTIWFWSDRIRNYTAAEVEMANMASGRVMNELEHKVLGEEVLQSRVLTQQMDQASIAQASRWPSSAPLHHEIEVSGCSIRDGMLGGSFHKWDIDPSEHIVALFGEATSSGPQGAMVATAIDAIVHSLWTQSKRPAEILQSVGDYLFEGGEEDWAAHATLLQIDPSSGRGAFATAGHNHLFIISHRGFRPLGSIAAPLASMPDVQFNCSKFVLQPGEVLIGMSKNLVEQLNLPNSAPSSNRSQPKSNDAYNKLRRERRALSKSLDQHEILREIKLMLDEDAHEISRHLCNRLPVLINREGKNMDRSLLVIRNAKKAIGHLMI